MIGNAVEQSIGGRVPAQRQRWIKDRGLHSALVDQVLEAKPSEPDALDHLANEPCGRMRFRRLRPALTGRKRATGFAVPGNGHLFLLLGQIEQLAEPVLLPILP